VPGRESNTKSELGEHETSIQGKSQTLAEGPCKENCDQCF
jgi:hypothetical protein